MRNKTNELKIDLEDEEIILLGNASESAGKLLKGTVTLFLSEPMRVRSVTLAFTGKMKVSWSEGIGHHQHYHKQEKEIIEHKWQFVPIIDQSSSKRTVFTLGAGEHKWHFDYFLPGHLPQSLEAEGGQVVYRLKAVVERTAFIQNIVKKLPVQIIRCMMPSEFELMQSMEIHNTWAEKIAYNILLPSKVYARGQSLPVNFNIIPLAERLRVRSLTCTLKEYCTYTTTESSKTDNRIVKQLRVEDPFPNEPILTENNTTPIVWAKELVLEIPPLSSHLAFCDADNEMIRIRHKLKFFICLINADGHLSELRCSVPIIIISSFSEQTEINTLPAYDQAWQTALCLEGPPSSSAIDIPPPSEQHSGASTPMEVPNSNTNEYINSDRPTFASPGAEPLWWNGTDLSRVPSYRTATLHNAVPFSNSLPSYDQLASSPRHNAMLEQLSITPVNNTSNNNIDHNQPTPPHSSTSSTCS
ncbi:MAG: hypothetical protein EXX96DRAFT_575140 [Benjaminiella poitrasii]|nr:MAG: hypothetical protein EXX96DRAFT_575140 [Benjaminiella poitrasii]